MKKTIPFREIMITHPIIGIKSSEKMGEIEIPMLKLRDVLGNPIISSSPLLKRSIRDDRLERFEMKPHDLLLTRQSQGEHQAGVCALNMEEDPITFSSHLIRVRIDETIADPMYYFLWLNSPEGRKAISEISRNSVVSVLRIWDLNELEVPFPKLAEQRRKIELRQEYIKKTAINQRMTRILLDLCFGENI